MHTFLSYPLLIHYDLSDFAFLTPLSPLYQLRSIPPVTRICSISAANTANLLNRNAWRPNCFSFEALRPSPRSQMGPCPPLPSHHFLLFATRTILCSIPFSTTRKMRNYDALVFYLSFFSFWVYMDSQFLFFVTNACFNNFNFYGNILHIFSIFSLSYILDFDIVLNYLLLSVNFVNNTHCFGVY